MLFRASGKGGNFIYCIILILIPRDAFCKISPLLFCILVVENQDERHKERKRESERERVVHNIA